MDSRLWLRRGGVPSSDCDEPPAEFELDDDPNPVDDLTMAPYVHDACYYDEGYQHLRAISFLLS
jgi:hypothetical protein